MKTLKIAKKWFYSMSVGLLPGPVWMYACMLVLFSWFFTVKTKLPDTD